MSAPVLTAAQRRALEMVAKCGYLLVTDDGPIASAWVSRDRKSGMLTLTDAGRAAMEEES